MQEKLDLYENSCSNIDKDDNVHKMRESSIKALQEKE